MGTTKLKKVKLTVSVEVPFYPYNTVVKNRKALIQIKRWLRDLLNNEACYVPLYVEKDNEAGGYIEDATSAIKYSIKGN